MGAEALGEGRLSTEDEEDSRCSVGVGGGGCLVLRTCAHQKWRTSSVLYASGVRLKCHLTMSVSVSVSVSLCKSQAIHQTVSTTVAGFMDETPRQSTITHSGPPTLVTRN